MKFTTFLNKTLATTLVLTFSCTSTILYSETPVSISNPAPQNSLTRQIAAGNNSEVLGELARSTGVRLPASRIMEAPMPGLVGASRSELRENVKLPDGSLVAREKVDRVIAALRKAGPSALIELWQLSSGQELSSEDVALLAPQVESLGIIKVERGTKLIDVVEMVPAKKSGDKPTQKTVKKPVEVINGMKFVDEDTRKIVSAAIQNADDLMAVEVVDPSSIETEKKSDAEPIKFQIKDPAKLDSLGGKKISEVKALAIQTWVKAHEGRTEDQAKDRVLVLSGKAFGNSFRIEISSEILASDPILLEFLREKIRELVKAKAIIVPGSAPLSALVQGVLEIELQVLARSELRAAKPEWVYDSQMDRSELELIAELVESVFSSDELDSLDVIGFSGFERLFEKKIELVLQGLREGRTSQAYQDLKAIIAKHPIPKAPGEDPDQEPEERTVASVIWFVQTKGVNLANAQGDLAIIYEFLKEQRQFRSELRSPLLFSQQETFSWTEDIGAIVFLAGLGVAFFGWLIYQSVTSFQEWRERRNEAKFLRAEFKIVGSKFSLGWLIQNFIRNSAWHAAQKLEIKLRKIHRAYVRLGQTKKERKQTPKRIRLEWFATKLNASDLEFLHSIGFDEANVQESARPFLRYVLSKLKLQDSADAPARLKALRDAAKSEFGARVHRIEGAYGTQIENGPAFSYQITLRDLHAISNFLASINMHRVASVSQNGAIGPSLDLAAARSELRSSVAININEIAVYRVMAGLMSVGAWFGSWFRLTSKAPKKKKENIEDVRTRIRQLYRDYNRAWDSLSWYFKEGDQGTVPHSSKLLAIYKNFFYVYRHLIDNRERVDVEKYIDEAALRKMVDEALAYVDAKTMSVARSELRQITAAQLRERLLLLLEQGIMRKAFTGSRLKFYYVDRNHERTEVGSAVVTHGDLGSVDPVITRVVGNVRALLGTRFETTVVKTDAPSTEAITIREVKNGVRSELRNDALALLATTEISGWWCCAVPFILFAGMAVLRLVGIGVTKVIVYFKRKSDERIVAGLPILRSQDPEIYARLEREIPDSSDYNKFRKLTQFFKKAVRWTRQGYAFEIVFQAGREVERTWDEYGEPGPEGYYGMTPTTHTYYEKVGRDSVHIEKINKTNASSRSELRDVSDKIDVASLNPTQRGALDLLIELGQTHLFDVWDAVGTNEDKKREFLTQIAALDQNYDGGLRAYKTNASILLEQTAKGINRFDGYTPQIPDAIEIPAEIDNELIQLESAGLSAANKLSVVLVAGGLGERLGYDGIKVAIPHDLLTNMSYFERYAKTILAIQKRSNQINGTDFQIPFVIMTSDETHEKTVEFLEQNSYFGLARGQVHLLKQSSLPALINNNGDFVLDEKNPYELAAKPSGHGDVHRVLANSGLVDQWNREGRTHTLFIQDTNGQVFNGVLSALAVSLRENFDMNFLTVPREAKEAAGAIVKMAHTNGTTITRNIEYGDLPGFLKATISPEGDVPDSKSGKSPFPGNLNVFIVKNETYGKVLQSTKGLIAPLVNPKYADEAKTKFTKPARLETMMQDVAINISEMGGRVGVTNFHDKRLVFSPVKNDLAGAAKKHKEGNYPDAMATGEFDLYKKWRKVLALAGVTVNVEGAQKLTRGIPYQDGAQVVFSPSFALMTDDVRQKIHGGSMTDRSTLVIEGEGVRLENVQLDGALVIRAAEGVNVTFKDLKVENKGVEFVELTDEELKMAEGALKIRGYGLKEHQALEFNISEPGDYVVGWDWVVRKRSELRADVTESFKEAAHLAEVAAGKGWISQSALTNIFSWGDEAHKIAHADLTAQFKAAGNDANAWKNINDDWYTILKAGTAGIRGKRGWGTNRINLFTLGLFQLAHANMVAEDSYDDLVREFDPEFNLPPAISIFKHDLVKKAVALGYDSRHGSYDPKTKQPGTFVKLEALINAAKGIRAYVFRAPTSTPQLSFTVHAVNVGKDYKIVSGSMSTASHNPSSDNGNKPYKPDGSQATGKFAEEINRHLGLITASDLATLAYRGINILENIDQAFDAAVANGDIKWIGGEDDIYSADEQFIKAELEETIHAVGEKFDPKYINLQNAKIVVSPLYGVSKRILKEIFKRRGLRDDQIVWVEDEPNPDFPNVKLGKPNPETPEAREVAIRKAVEVDADLVLWTDPDADRPAVAAKINKNKVAASENDYASFNGNQQLAILIHYLISELVKIRDRRADRNTTTDENAALAQQAEKIAEELESVLVASTVVSGDLMKVIARAGGARVVETLTGFKYIGDQVEKRSKAIQQAAQITESKWIKLPKAEKIRLALEHSELFLFGGEESLGSLSSDGPHDKDAISGVMWFVEILGRFADRSSLSLPAYLNDLYKDFGYFVELFPMLQKGKKYAGVELSEEDAMKVIKGEDGPSILNTFRKNPPLEIGGKKVIAVLDFWNQTAKSPDGTLLFDADSHSGLITPDTEGIPGFFRKQLSQIRVPSRIGNIPFVKGIYSFAHTTFKGSKDRKPEKLPKENFIMLLLEDGSKVIARPSGTEPVIKFYINGRGLYSERAKVDAWLKTAAADLEKIADDIARERFPEKFTKRSELRADIEAWNTPDGKVHVRFNNKQQVFSTGDELVAFLKRHQIRSSRYPASDGRERIEIRPQHKPVLKVMAPKPSVGSESRRSELRNDVDDQAILKATIDRFQSEFPDAYADMLALARGQKKGVHPPTIAALKVLGIANQDGKVARSMLELVKKIILERSGAATATVATDQKATEASEASKFEPKSVVMTSEELDQLSNGNPAKLRIAVVLRAALTRMVDEAKAPEILNQDIANGRLQLDVIFTFKTPQGTKLAQPKKAGKEAIWLNKEFFYFVSPIYSHLGLGSIDTAKPLSTYIESIEFQLKKPEVKPDVAGARSELRASSSNLKVVEEVTEDGSLKAKVTIGDEVISGYADEVAKTLVARGIDARTEQGAGSLVKLVIRVEKGPTLIARTSKEPISRAQRATVAVQDSAAAMSELETEWQTQGASVEDWLSARTSSNTSKRVFSVEITGVAKKITRARGPQDSFIFSKPTGDVIGEDTVGLIVSYKGVRGFVPFREIPVTLLADFDDEARRAVESPYARHRRSVNRDLSHLVGQRFSATLIDLKEGKDRRHQKEPVFSIEKGEKINAAQELKAIQAEDRVIQVQVVGVHKFGYGDSADGIFVRRGSVTGIIYLTGIPESLRSQVYFLRGLTLNAKVRSVETSGDSIFADFTINFKDSGNEKALENGPLGQLKRAAGTNQSVKVTVNSSTRNYNGWNVTFAGSVHGFISNRSLEYGQKDLVPGQEVDAYVTRIDAESGFVQFSISKPASGFGRERVVFTSQAPDPAFERLKARKKNKPLRGGLDDTRWRSELRLAPAIQTGKLEDLRAVTSRVERLFADRTALETAGSALVPNLVNVEGKVGLAISRALAFDEGILPVFAALAKQTGARIVVVAPTRLDARLVDATNREFNLSSENELLIASDYAEAARKLRSNGISHAAYLTSSEGERELVGRIFNEVTVLSRSAIQAMKFSVVGLAEALNQAKLVYEQIIQSA